MLPNNNEIDFDIYIYHITDKSILTIKEELSKTQFRRTDEFIKTVEYQRSIGTPDIDIMKRYLCILYLPGEPIHEFNTDSHYVPPMIPNFNLTEHLNSMKNPRTLPRYKDPNKKISLAIIGIFLIVYTIFLCMLIPLGCVIIQ